MTVPTSQRRCLVTGGAGFIGSHLVEALLARGDHVTVVDNLSTGRRGNLAAAESTAGDRLRTIVSTVAEALPILDAGDYDEIYHLAAAVGVRLVVERPIATIETNVHETAAILRFAAAADTPVLITSTSEVYGKGVRSPFSEDDDVVYGPTTLSRWSYACSKAIDEYLALAHHREHGLPVAIVRLFNTVGPRQVGEYGMVLPRFVRAALAGDEIEVHGDGEQSRCFCDVRDIVPGLIRILGTPECLGRVLNLGHDRPITIRALAELVRATLDSPSSIRLVPYAEAFGDASSGFDDLRFRQPDLSRVREAIGFAPQVPLERTIRDLASTMDLSGQGATPSNEVPR